MFLRRFVVELPGFGKPARPLSKYVLSLAARKLDDGCPVLKRCRPLNIVNSLTVMQDRFDRNA